MAKITGRYPVPIRADISNYPSIHSQYSEGVIGIPSGTGKFPSWVRIDRLWSGIKIEWDTTDISPYIRILRKLRDHPRTSEDGIVVYEGTSSTGKYEDTNAIRGEYNYYSLWFSDSLTGPWSSTPSLFVYDFCLNENDYIEFIHNLLPDMYFTEIKEVDDANDLNLLVRYIMGWVFREIEDLIDFIPALMDVDRTPGGMLKALAEYVGLEPNYELTYIQQRMEIKAAVENYKKRGLKEAIEQMVTAVSGVRAVVVDYNRQIIYPYINRPATAKIDAFHTIYYMLPEDDNPKIISFGTDTHDIVHYGVYLYPESGLSLDDRTLKKVFRVVKDFQPVYENAVVWVVLNYEDNMDLLFTEDVETVVEDAINEDVSGNVGLLFTNDLSTGTNDLNYGTLNVNPDEDVEEQVS